MLHLLERIRQVEKFPELLHSFPSRYFGSLTTDLHKHLIQSMYKTSWIVEFSTFAELKPDQTESCPSLQNDHRLSHLSNEPGSDDQD